MNITKPWRFVLVGTSTVLTGAMLVTVGGLLGMGPTAHNSMSGHGLGGQGLAVGPGSFVIEGKAAGLISPGVMAPFDLTFTNAHDTPISITDLTVTVLKVQASKADFAHPCSVGDFTVNQAASDLKIKVAARTALTLSSFKFPRAQWPQVGMPFRSVNQDGCKGASLTLGFTASGTGAT